MRLAMSVLAVAILIAYAGLSGLWVTNSSAWYLSLRRPFWQPPNWVFGVIWPYNFVMLGWVSVLAVLNFEEAAAWMWLGTLLFSVICAISWSYCFYVLKRLALAAMFLVVTALSTLVLTFLSSAVSTTSLVAFIPYEVWLLVAASLSIGYWRLNR